MDNFQSLCSSIVGHHHPIQTPYGQKELIYMDWTASGRLFYPIGERMLHVFGPMVANTHTESNTTGAFTTKAYHEALHLINQHVHANENDVIITDGSGATGVINKFQRLLGLRFPSTNFSQNVLPPHKRPVVFITHMEHHSNHTSWLENIADVVVLEPNGKRGS